MVVIGRTSLKLINSEVYAIHVGNNNMTHVQDHFDLDGLHLLDGLISSIMNLVHSEDGLVTGKAIYIHHMKVEQVPYH